MTALDQRLARGMTLVPQMPDLGKNEVSEDMRAVYDDIEGTLRVPFVNFIFRTLANWPKYFKPAWNTLAPHLRGLEFERSADYLRAAAAPDSTVEPLSEEIMAQGDWRARAAFTDAIHYVLPKLLLVVTALDQQWQGTFTIRKVPERLSNEELPYGPAQGAGRLPLLDPDAAGARVQALFRDIQQVHHHPGVASYYRGLGHYPDFLAAVWQEIRRHVDSDSYQQRKQALIEAAETMSTVSLLEERSQPIAAGAEPIGAVLAIFRYRLIPDLLLDVTLIKAMQDGPEAAACSQLSLCR